MGVVILNPMKAKPFIRKAHRWLGLLFALSVLLSSGSGVVHTIMTRTQSPPPPARPSGTKLDPDLIQLSLPQALASIAPIEAQAVNVRQIQDQPWYQIYTGDPGPPLYASAVDGRLDPAMDAQYAAEIASAFLGGVPVRKTAYLTEFNNEYINIFRVLPVYRFDADDARHTRVYVSTTTGSVTRHTDDRRQFEASIFTTFHKFGFIPDKTVRDIVLTTTTFGVFIASLFGVVLFFLTRQPKAGSSSSRQSSES